MRSLHGLLTAQGSFEPRVSVLECASPLALWKSWVVESARELAHSKTLRRYERFTVRIADRRNFSPEMIVFGSRLRM